MDVPWRFGVNDPGLVGWLTVATYLGTAALCWVCSWKADQFAHSDSSNQRRVWRALGLLMLMMGFNKQLDLQTPLIAFGRDLIKYEGWDRQRSHLKWLFISSLGIVVSGC